MKASKINTVKLEYYPYQLIRKFSLRADLIQNTLLESNTEEKNI
jgi:hypothetical protein